MQRNGHIEYPDCSGVYVVDMDFTPLAVKIGYTGGRHSQRIRHLTIDLKSKLGSERYPIGYRPKLVAFIELDGERASRLERQLHRMFSEYHCPNPVFTKEVFYFDGAVRAFADDLRKKVLGLDPYQPEAPVVKGWQEDYTRRWDRRSIYPCRCNIGSGYNPKKCSRHKTDEVLRQLRQRLYGAIKAKDIKEAKRIEKILRSVY